MTTGRRPTLTPDELDDTADDLITSARREPTDPGRRFPVGSRPLPDLDAIEAAPRRTTGPVPRLASEEIERAAADRAYFDIPPDEHDLRDRVTALEIAFARKTTLRKWIDRAISALAGSAVAVLVWALSKADANGDARGSARERAAEFDRMRDTVDDLKESDARHTGQIESLLERLRYYPVHGPAMPPQGTTP